MTRRKFFGCVAGSIAGLSMSNTIASTRTTYTATPLSNEEWRWHRQLAYFRAASDHCGIALCTFATSPIEVVEQMILAIDPHMTFNRDTLAAALLRLKNQETAAYAV